MFCIVKKNVEINFSDSLQGNITLNASWHRAGILSLVCDIALSSSWYWACVLALLCDLTFFTGRH
jgi:hypothetical protein